MLGEQIAELKGKMIGQRVLDSEGPTMEISVSLTGSIRGTPVKYTITSVARPTSAGVLHGEAKGVIMAGESDMAFTVGEFGRINPAGGIKFHGAHFYRTSSNGKLASLNNVVGVFEGEIDAEGNADRQDLGMEVAAPHFVAREGIK